jgi:hypothetical protein
LFEGGKNKGQAPQLGGAWLFFEPEPVAEELVSQDRKKSKPVCRSFPFCWIWEKTKKEERS